MDESERKKQSFQSVLAIVSALVTAITFSLNFTSWIPADNTLNVNILAAISFIVFCCLVWSLIRGLKSELEDKTPSIDVVGQPFPRDVNMGTTQPDGSFQPQAISVMANVAFANNPKHRTDKNHAHSVRAEITFLDEDHKVLLGPVEGRWGQTNQPSKLGREERHKIESVDFPNNGGIRNLDFILKYPEDEHCYAFNNDSYDFAVLFQNPSFELKTKHFFVDVVLKGAYIPSKPWEFEVKTNGKDDSYEVKYNGEWQRPMNSHATKYIPQEVIRVIRPPSSFSQSS